jgi:hypothetical protein
MWKGLGADSEEKHEPASDIDTVVVDRKRLTPNGRIEKRTFIWTGVLWRPSQPWIMLWRLREGLLPFRKSYFSVAMMQSRQNGHSSNVSVSLDRST